MFRQSQEGGRGELSALADAGGGRFPPRPEFDVSHLGSFRPGWPRGQHIPVDSPPERNPQEKLSQRGQRARRVGRAVHGGRAALFTGAGLHCSRGPGRAVHWRRAALFTGAGPRHSWELGPGSYRRPSLSKWWNSSQGAQLCEHALCLCWKHHSSLKKSKSW